MSLPMALASLLEVIVVVVVALDVVEELLALSVEGTSRCAEVRVGSKRMA